MKPPVYTLNKHPNPTNKHNKQTNKQKQVTFFLLFLRPVKQDYHKQNKTSKQNKKQTKNKNKGTSKNKNKQNL